MTGVGVLSPLDECIVTSGCSQVEKKRDNEEEGASVCTFDDLKQSVHYAE